MPSPQEFSPPYQRLFVNIDHVATLRQARRGRTPDPVLAATACELAGADGITAHLREDRRHINDDDIRRLSATLRTALNFECAATAEMVALAEALRPSAVTLVPERREEVTTEGGLDVSHGAPGLRDAIARLKRAGVRTSLFIDATPDAVQRSLQLGADAVELHTGPYSHAGAQDGRALETLVACSALASGLGLSVHAGHGLSILNVRAVAAIPEIEELNIGHAIVGRAIFVGLNEAVREIRVAMTDARAALHSP